jgi:hypothetical protein
MRSADNTPLTEIETGLSMDFTSAKHLYCGVEIRKPTLGKVLQCLTIFVKFVIRNSVFAVMNILKQASHCDFLEDRLASALVQSHVSYWSMLELLPKETDDLTSLGV